MIRAQEPIFDLTAMASSLVDVLTSKQYDMTSEAGLTIHAVECLKVQVRNSYNKKLQQVTQIWQEQKTRPMRLFFWKNISPCKRSPPECLRSLDCRMVSWFTKTQMGLRTFASTAARYATQKCEKIRLSFWWIIWWEKKCSCVLLGPRFEDADVFG